MKNLLYIGNKLSNKGKTVTSIETLSKLLLKEGNNVTAVSNKKNKLLRLIHMLATIFKRRKSTDYVLIDTYSTQNFYYAFFTGMLSNMLKLKYIPMLRGGNLISRLENNKKLSSLLFNKAYVNIAPSLFTKSAFEKYGYTNVKCIPNTIEIEKYEFEERKYSDIRLLWVRSFSEIYNPELAIKVLRKLKDLNENVSLCMVGPDNDGSLSKIKKLTEQLNVEVEFTGKLEKHDWIKKSKDHNIFINTTNFDNMPVSVIEAMALGMPTVSTNVGGMPYLISHEKDGLLVKKNNVNEMVNAILLIKNDASFRSELVKNARKKAEDFSWDKNKILWNDLLI